MTAKRKITLCCAALALLASGCSSLRVTTEVYMKEHDQIQDRATIIGGALSDLEANLGGKKKNELFSVVDKTAFGEKLALVWDELRELGGGVFAGTSEVFAVTFLETVQSVTLDRQFILKLQRLADRLADRDRAYYGKSMLLYEKSRELEEGYREIVDKVNSAPNEVATATKATAGGGAIYDSYYISREDWNLGSDEVKPLKEYTGENEYEPAIATLKQRRDEADRILDSLIDSAFPFEEELMDYFEAVDSSLVVLPLADPLVPRIVSAPDESWEGVYNHVLGRTWFGNAEIAIRMENLGEFHMKGVVFDSGKVAKATLDGIHSAIQIVGAAYGLPITAGAADGEADTATVSRASLRAEINAIQGETRRRIATKAEGFYEILGHLQSLSTTANVTDDEIAGIADSLDSIANRLAPPIAYKEDE